MADLNQLRHEIDTINQQLEQLLIQRFNLVTEVGNLKQATQLPVCDPQREAEILAQVGQADPSLKEPLQQVFKTIMAQSRALERQ